MYFFRLQSLGGLKVKSNGDELEGDGTTLIGLKEQGTRGDQNLKAMGLRESRKWKIFKVH